MADNAGRKKMTEIRKDRGGKGGLERLVRLRFKPLFPVQLLACSAVVPPTIRTQTQQSGAKVEFTHLVKWNLGRRSTPLLQHMTIA